MHRWGVGVERGQTDFFLAAAATAAATKSTALRFGSISYSGWPTSTTTWWANNIVQHDWQQQDGRRRGSQQHGRRVTTLAWRSLQRCMIYSLIWFLYKKSWFNLQQNVDSLGRKRFGVGRRRGRLESRHWAKLPRGFGHLSALRQTENHPLWRREDVR